MVEQSARACFYEQVVDRRLSATHVLQCLPQLKQGVQLNVSTQPEVRYRLFGFGHACSDDPSHRRQWNDGVLGCHGYSITPIAVLTAAVSPCARMIFNTP